MLTSNQDKENQSDAHHASFKSEELLGRPLLVERNAQDPFSLPLLPSNLNTSVKPFGPREIPKARPLPPLPPSAPLTRQNSQDTRPPSVLEHAISQPTPPSSFVPPPTAIIQEPQHISPPATVSTSQELSIPLNDTNGAPKLSTGSVFPPLMRKQSYVGLPEPSPLRKSMRGLPTRAPNVNTATTTPVVPAAPAGGVRSSWLRGGPRDTTWAHKGKLSINPSILASNGIAGVKRKSGELGDGGDQRVKKIAKKEVRLDEAEDISQPVDTAMDEDKHSPVLERGEEDTAELLRKLRTRLGVVKTNELVATAQKTVNQEDKMEVDILQQSAVSSIAKPTRHSREDRLSVSHLVSVYDPKPHPAITCQSIAMTLPSTTPARSPPRKPFEMAPTHANVAVAQVAAPSSTAPFSFKTNIFKPLNTNIFTAPPSNVKPMEWPAHSAILSAPTHGPSSQGTGISSQSTVVTELESVFDSQSQPMSQAGTSFHFSQEQHKPANEATFTGWTKYQDDDVDDWARPIPDQPFVGASSDVDSDGDHTHVPIAIGPINGDSDWDEDEHDQEPEVERGVSELESNPSEGTDVSSRSDLVSH